MPYPRHNQGSTLTCTTPPRKSEVDPIEVVSIQSEYVIVTEGSNVHETRCSHTGECTRPHAICAHYYINRRCRLGNQCQFIHFAVMDLVDCGKRVKRRTRLAGVDMSTLTSSSFSIDSSDAVTLEEDEVLSRLSLHSGSPVASPSTHHQHEPYPASHLAALGLMPHIISDEPQPVASLPAALHQHDPYGPVLHVSDLSHMR